MRRSRRRAGSGVRGGRRRGSGRRKGFWVTAQLGAERLGQGGESDMAMPALIVAALEMVQAEAVFEFAVVVLDAPADLGESNQCPQWSIGRQIGQPVVGGPARAGWPFGQEPTFAEAAVGMSGNVAVGWTDSQGHEPRPH